MVQNSKIHDDQAEQAVSTSKSGANIIVYVGHRPKYAERVFLPQTPPFLFANWQKRGAVNAIRGVTFCLIFSRFLPPAAAGEQQGSIFYAAGAMSTMDVQFAASVLGLESDVGPLGDMTSEVRVAQDFNHELLEPALQELKSALRVGRFEGQHVDLAEKLLHRIKKLLRTRRERDRVRREKQVCLLQSHGSVRQYVYTAVD